MAQCPQCGASCSRGSALTSRPRGAGPRRARLRRRGRRVPRSGHALVERAVGSDGVDDVEAEARAEGPVVLVERGRSAQQARAFARRDEAGQQDGVAALAEVAAGSSETAARSARRRSRRRGSARGCVRPRGRRERARRGPQRRPPARPARRSSPDVGQLGVDGHRRVGGERPCGGRPGQQLVAGLQPPAVARDREADATAGSTTPARAISSRPARCRSAGNAPRPSRLRRAGPRRRPP